MRGPLASCEPVSIGFGLRRLQACRMRCRGVADRFRTWLPALLRSAGPVVVVLLCGGDKRTETRDIRTAQNTGRSTWMPKTNVKVDSYCEYLIEAPKDPE